MNEESTTSFLRTRGTGCTAAERTDPGKKAEPVRPRTPSLFRAHVRDRSFREDRRGHVFLLVGLLLAMGTVTLGGVMVTMQAHEETASREQKENLMDPVQRLLTGFNESVQRLVPLGETNVTLFQDRAAELERRLHVQAAKDGIYLKLGLDTAPDPSHWQSAGRCPSFDPGRSRNGVVIGYEPSTQRETIVGALFDLHATDGHQVVRFPYYVKLHSCLPTHLTTSFSGIRVTDGWVLNPEAAKSANDNNAVMTIGELPVGSVLVHHNLTMDDETLAQNGWENERYWFENDTRHSHHPATPLSDYLLAKADVSQAPPDMPLTDVRVRTDAFHSDVKDDYLQMRALWNGAVLGVWQVPTTPTEETFYYDLPVSPSGRLYWTPEELADLEVEMQVIEVDSFDPPAFFMVEYVDVQYDFTAPERYSFVATIDWPVVPSLYDHHRIEVRYTYTNSTPGEAFELQVLSNGTWETRMSMVSTDGNWSTLSYSLTEWEIESGILEMRIVDTIDDDQWGTDIDELYVDYLQLFSEVDET